MERIDTFMNGRGVHLVADIGTSSLKTALLTDNAEIVAEVKIPLLSMAGADLSSWDPLLWDRAFADACRQLKPGAGLESVTVSGHGPTMIPMDGSGRPVANALLWLNRRAPENIPPSNVSYFLPLAGWLREERPEVFSKTAFFCTCPGYLSYRLSGVPAAVSPQPEFTPFLWTPDQLSSWGFSSSMFPEPFLTGSRIGFTGRYAAENFGLPEGVPVFAGGPDYTMALIGSGVVRPGMTCDRAGTSEGINYCSSSMPVSERLRILPHAVTGIYTVAGILASTGRVFEWFRAITNQSGREYSLILQEIRALDPSTPAPRFFPSRHRGPVWDFNNGIFAGLHPEHTHLEMGKAVVEAIAFGIRDVLDTLGASGFQVAEIRGTGGQYRNPDWNCMKADILGVPLDVPAVIDGELMGNLCAALTGAGRFNSISEAAENLVTIRDHVEPDLSKTQIYNELYAAYKAECLLFTSPETNP